MPFFDNKLVGELKKKGRGIRLHFGELVNPIATWECWHVVIGWACVGKILEAKVPLRIAHGTKALECLNFLTSPKIENESL